MDLDLTASATPTGPHSHHAPVDPTLPKPWRSFVDGTTGYLYFWNPETNVTQYERPIAAPHPLPTLEPALVPRRSLVQMEQPSGSSVQGWQYHISADESSRHNGGHSHGPKQASLPAAQNLQDTRGTFSLSQNDLNGSINTGYDGQPFRSSAGAHGPADVGVGSSPESYRDHHEITVIGRNVPVPFMTIESTGFPLEILEEARHAGFSAPTSIQAQSWPIALQSRDILAVAKMALGKTLSYLIPGFIHLKRFGNNNRLGPRMMVLSPTRELAIQIQDDAVKFGRSLRISCTCLYGGVPKGPQLRDLDQGTDIVVATPGRLNDILEMRRLSLHQVSYLVLDEADRVMDMGFEPLIRKIVREIPTRRQTLMYTGVLTKEVYKLAADLLFHPVQVNIGVIDNPFPPLTKADESVAPLRKADELVVSPGKADEFAGKKITQYVEVTRPMAKTRRLEQILKSQEPGSKVIVFCSNKKMCDSLAKNILRKFGAASIKSQDIRDRVLNQFQTGKSPILVATDVAVQGLDVNDIRVVINFDFPTGMEDYIHRVSMADSTGVSYTFFCDQDAKHASDLIRVLEGSRQEVPADLRAIAAQGGGVATPRRWGSNSAGQEGGSLQGSGHNDSNNDASAGLGTLASGGSSSAHDDRGPSDRFERTFNNGHEDDVQGRHDWGLHRG